MVKSTLACGLQECLSKEWMGDNFRDFRVVVDGSEYFCHKFILSACSSFFRGLFRTNLREKQEERVKLHDMSKETFDVIINSIYKGVDGLTVDNVLNIWQAVHLLDISFLIQECEIFVMEKMSLDNYITYYHMAKLLQSETVINFSIGFMKKHFEHFQNTETFLELSFPLLFSLIDDDSLNVNSEDLVLESIIKWVLYEPVHKKPSQGKDMDFKDTSSEEENSKTTFNKTDCGVQDQFEADVQKNSDDETKGDRTSIANKDTLYRKECIVELLSTARTFLASRSYLERILIHPLLKSFDEAQEIVYEALLYQWRSVSFPSNFVIPHRNCSGKRNVMVFAKSQKLHCFELNTQGTFKIKIDLIVFGGLASFDSTLCCFSYSSEGQCEFCLSSRFSKTHRHITTIDSKKEVSTIYTICENSRNELVSQNGVFINITNDKCTKQNTTANAVNCLQYVHDSSYESVCVFQDNILFFSNSCNNSKPSVNAHCYNIYTKSTQDVNFEGPANHIKSFSTGARKTFILQKNGALRSVHVTDDSKIEFTFVSQLWNNFQWILNGAVYYKKELTLFCSKKPEDVDSSLVKSLPGIIGKINVVEIESESNLVPLVIQESWLIQP